MNGNLLSILHDSPIIAAVKHESDLSGCLNSDVKTIFILYGDLINTPKIVSRAKDAGKTVFVHLDFIEGLAARDVAVDFIAQNTKADGVISTKPNLVRKAKAMGLLAIQRFFVLDSIALNNIEKQFLLEHADAIEILPGVMPKVIKKIVAYSKKPIIAGGLISDKEDVMSALGAGAVAVSSSNRNVWLL